VTWAKVDDQFAEHPKVLALGRDRFAGMGLWLLGLTYANRFLTDGFIPDAALPAGSRKLAARLVEVRLWEHVSGGYRIHDFGDYQPSREEVNSLRAARAEAGRKGGLRSGSTRLSKGEANASASAQAPAKPPLEANANPGHYPAETETDTTTPGPSSEVVVAYQEAYGRQPPASASAWLADMEGRFGPERTLAAFHGEHRKNPDPSSLFGRMEQGLKLGNQLHIVEGMGT
jgi:hypothetical protein